MVMTTVTSFLHVIVHYVRAGWSYILSFILHRRNSDFGADTNANGSFMSLFHGQQRPIIKFDDCGIQVSIGNQIAEGGFSYIFEAFPKSQKDNFDVGRKPRKQYALKRINCANNHELIQACKSEANVHRVLFQSSVTTSSAKQTSNNNNHHHHHPNLLELLGLKFVDGECCYMLFPYIPHSLRGEITKRNILNGIPGQRMPFSTREVLRIFGGLIDALIAMHAADFSHRDVKIENVLLKKSNPHRGYRDDNFDHYIPVLMDYGSVGPLRVVVHNMTMASLEQNLRASPFLSTTTTKIAEDASMFTTMSYRPPELFEGGLTTMKQSIPSENVLDYGKVDVWSLGCILFGLMHGSSPFEIEFLRTHNDNYDAYYHTNHRQQRQQQEMLQERQYGLVRIIECTHLKILGEVPFPPWSATSSDSEEGDGKNGKYPLTLHKFVQYMVHHDRSSRPNIHNVAERFGNLHLELLGEQWISNSCLFRQQRVENSRRVVFSDDTKGNSVANLNHDDFDLLIASRRGEVR